MNHKKNQTSAEGTPPKMESVREWVTLSERQIAIANSLERAHAQAAQFLLAEPVSRESRRCLSHVTISSMPQPYAVFLYLFFSLRSSSRKKANSTASS